MIPPLFIVAVASAGLAFGGAWFIQENKYETKLSQYQLEYTIALEKATADALEKTNALQKAKDEAERKNQTRLADMRRSLSRAGAVADGLRGDLETARSALPNATCDSVREYAATLNTISNECRGALLEMAGNAQGHAIDTLKLLEQWPTKSAPF